MDDFLKLFLQRHNLVPNSEEDLSRAETPRLVKKPRYAPGSGAFSAAQLERETQDAKSIPRYVEDPKCK
jgi:hypothetical protein